ncbi:MAG: 2OG-Fe(II) oxygenase [Sandaracinus sp.]|nr:2OG-Fe(II) oxygenase [Sandaracinus sp.]MCB9624127.1 2OG-Fe(II) oxygenase [Sandaracinus sp.]MCB9634232.1 2OG-Fe(II) oxygenase [Sandaracinus sp.]
MGRESTFFFERNTARAVADAAKGRWSTAKPFPHVVIDGLLPEEVVREAARAFPRADHPGFKRRDYAEQAARFGQLQRRAFEGVAPELRHLLNEVNGMVFLDLLSRVSDVEGLIPDPHFTGAGLHLTLPGGHLALHADFDRDRRRGLARVLSVVLFLVETWDESWGGHLELWDESLTRCEARIAPHPGRLVVFAHGDRCWHGHPTPLACPEGHARQSLAAYYYVADARPKDEGHSAIWAPRVDEENA